MRIRIADEYIGVVIEIEPYEPEVANPDLDSRAGVATPVGLDGSRSHSYRHSYL
ncbi:hypothetical protein [Rhodococcus sp. Leaf225]|uniref:hypothetical protein n=1 Tax=Rhodococcus sp. Leaf225 TaxID=1736300 RepID=UPI000AC110AE|nr:hypothetical protein [Rhodococcus sp. Leaf225]